MMKRLFPLIAAVSLLLVMACGSNKQSSKQKNPQEMITVLCVNDFATLAESHAVRLIDVRTSHEYAEGHIAGAENIDVQKPDFVERVRPRGDKPIALYCRSGKRSAQAAQKIAEYAAQGKIFTGKLYDLGGGFNAWQQAGKPSVK